MSRPTSKNPFGFGKLFLLLLIAGAAALMISPVYADTGNQAVTGNDGTVTITPQVNARYFIWEDSITFSGTNTGSEITYLFLTGPNLNPGGAQIQSIHPGQSPVIDGDASTFQAARVGPDNTWSFTWDTHNVMIDAGVYTVYAASTPRDLLNINSTHFDRISFIMARPRGTETSKGGNVSADTGVTIAAQGVHSYYPGEKVVLSGHNYDSATTYLFMTGPGTFVTGPGIPGAGGKLTSPLQQVVSGNPDTFTAVKTNPDASWEYSWYTANLPVDAGSYTVYAVSPPKTKDQLGPDAASVGIILKKPFITAEISPATITKGMPITVSGFAEGNPPAVQIWILGKNYSSTSFPAVNTDASFTHEVSREVTSQFESGQYFVIVQHPMQNNQFDINTSGDYVMKNGTILFKITGPGSLQGIDAVDALVAAFPDREANDDTYTLVPFQVTDAVSTMPTAQPSQTMPVERKTSPDILPFALIGGVVLILGIVMWKRR